MDLMKFRIEEVHGFNEMRASHNDLLPVQKSMGIEGWLVFCQCRSSCSRRVERSMACNGTCSNFEDVEACQ